jgi:hypothetical protein
MSLNWDRLVGQGRAKDIGIAWQEDELTLLYEIVKTENASREEVAGYLRKGAKSVGQFRKMKAKNEVKTREDVEKEAADAGVEFAPEAPTTVLEKEIEQKNSDLREIPGDSGKPAKVKKTRKVRKPK